MPTWSSSRRRRAVGERSWDRTDSRWQEGRSTPADAAALAAAINDTEAVAGGVGGCIRPLSARACRRYARVTRACVRGGFDMGSSRLREGILSGAMNELLPDRPGWRARHRRALSIRSALTLIGASALALGS